MKKRTLAVVLIMIMSVLCTACGNGGSSQAVNTVARWTPQDEQAKQLVQLLTMNKNASIISYTSDETIKNVELGCRYYEKGKLISDESHGSFALTGEEEGAKTSEGLIAAIRNEKDLELSASFGGSNCSISDIEIPGYTKDEKDHSFAAGELAAETPFEEGKPVYLVAYYNSEDGETSAYDPQQLAEDPEALKANDRTWIIYAVFSGKASEQASY